LLPIRTLAGSIDTRWTSRLSPARRLAIVNNERPNAFTELGPTATHARLFDEQFESIEDGVNESMAIVEAVLTRWTRMDVFYTPGVRLRGIPPVTSHRRCGTSAGELCDHPTRSRRRNLRDASTWRIDNAQFLGWVRSRRGIHSF
jgi:hypothetical protein